jgi:hypothetical protein
MGAKDRLQAAAVAGLLLTGFPSAFAQNWTLTSAPITNWSAIAMSADGSKLMASSGTVNGSSGLLYFSTNAGATWVIADTPTQGWAQAWASVATSADGTKWIAAPYWQQGVYISTNAAANWTLTAVTDTNNNWTCVRSSADGESLLAADFGTGPHFPSLLFVSTNAGATWSKAFESGTIRITAVATSADGIRCFLAGGYFDGSILASSDGAQTWMETAAPDVSWTCMAVSADGRRCVAAARYGGIYTFTNGGMNWTVTSGPFADWKGLASSADGSKLVAVANGTLIYVSTNFGASWLPVDGPNTNWSSVASSADGCKLAATVDGGGIYTWQTAPSPKLIIAPTAGGLLISWIVPSMPFVLQENADLNTADWTAVPMTPILNLTNLHHEVTVPLSGTNRFYRLQHL